MASLQRRPGGNAGKAALGPRVPVRGCQTGKGTTNSSTKKDEWCQVAATGPPQEPPTIQLEMTTEYNNCIGKCDHLLAEPRGGRTAPTANRI